MQDPMPNILESSDFPSALGGLFDDHFAAMMNDFDQVTVQMIQRVRREQKRSDKKKTLI